MKSRKSPYLENGRLEDIIAAILAMGVNPWAKSQNWGNKLDEPLSAHSWKDIFAQHPEFFRVSGEWVALRWRYTYNKTYDAGRHKELTDTEIEQLTDPQKKELTHKPLSNDQIETLITYHSRNVRRLC